mgnify:CR=1 FL=1
MQNFQIKGKATCRVVYPQGLFEKKQVKGAEGDPKYNAIILVPKTDDVKVSQIKEQFAEAFKELQNKGFKGKAVSAINPKNNCFVDGDVYADEQEGKDAFRGYYMLKVASKNFRPIVTDLQKRVILNGVPLQGIDAENISDEELCDGDYIHANVSFWTYCNPTASGIGCNIHAVMRVAEGERIGGASKRVEDYIQIDGEDYE